MCEDSATEKSRIMKTGRILERDAYRFVIFCNFFVIFSF